MQQPQNRRTATQHRNHQQQAPQSAEPQTARSSRGGRWAGGERAREKQQRPSSSSVGWIKAQREQTQRTAGGEPDVPVTAGRKAGGGCCWSAASDARQRALRSAAALRDANSQRVQEDDGPLRLRMLLPLANGFQCRHCIDRHRCLCSASSRPSTSSGSSCEVPPPAPSPRHSGEGPPAPPVHAVNPLRGV